MTIFRVILLGSLLSVASAASGIGCFASSGDLEFNDSYTWQSSSYCTSQCTDAGASVLGLTLGGDCWCGNAIPDHEVDSSYCNTPCFGWNAEPCGGTGYFTVFLTGVGTVENPEALTGGDSSSASSSASSVSSAASSVQASTRRTHTSFSAAASTSDSVSSTTSSSELTTSTTTTSSSTTSTSTSQADSTVYATTEATITLSASSTAVASPVQTSPVQTVSASDSNTSTKSGIGGGAIAGIVIGVIVGLAAIGALAFFIIRHRRARDNDEGWVDYRGKRTAPSYNAPPLPQEKLSSNSVNSGRVAIVDQRLNPVMMDRRMSDGSVSDEQDYSRKILRVVNMD
ncbi:hypothetical protein V1512DRAFT_288215 [Lipomyces arxii]|uniref:uncharacterized protein n=1 Tax=Lipomyces arxii TaxID=56418 RepID=UPI0034CE9046